MDFDKPKVYGDTFISDGLVFNAIGGFANPDDDDCERSRSILVSP